MGDRPVEPSEITSGEALLAEVFDSDVMRTLIFAIEYHAAAQAVDQVPEYKRGEGDTFRPAMFLVGQSIELALKAYLRMRGLSGVKLQREYGHNLRRLLRLAEKKGLDIHPLAESDRTALIDANVLYSRKHLQYALPGTHMWPSFDQLSRMAAVAIYRAIDATQFAHFLLLQDCAAPILHVLQEINRAGAKQVFRLPEIVSLEQLIARREAELG